MKNARTTSRFAALAAASVLAVTAMAWAQPAAAHGHHHHGGHHRGPAPELMTHHAVPFAGFHSPRLLAKVDATEAQRTQIRKLTQEAHQDIAKLREQDRGLRDEAQKLWTAPQIDAKAAEQLRQKLQASRDRVSQRQFKLALDVARVLTPEQRTKLGEHLKQRQERRAHHGKGHRPDRMHRDAQRPDAPAKPASAAQ